MVTVASTAFFMGQYHRPNIASADDTVAARQPSPEEMKKMMQRWQEVMTPGKEHAALGMYVGDWNIQTEMWMAGPKGPSTKSKGTASFKWILGKRFIQQNFNGSMMMPTLDGKVKKINYEGFGITGYDKYKKLYVGSWCDSMGTQLLNFSGTAHPNGKTIRMFGTADEPMLSMSGRHIKYETVVINKDKFLFRIYDLPAGDDYKVIEITYTRKK